MHIERNIGDARYTVIVRHHTRERLRDTCFRGISIVRAGNFSAWPTIYSLLNDERILDKIISEMRELSSNGLSEIHSFEIEFQNPIGWSSTDDLDKYSKFDLEEFCPNRRSTGLKVKKDRNEILAPKTNLITIVFELKDEGNSLTAVIHSLYPGRDIGNLFDDVSSRESVVFFDWSHPGEK